MNPFTYTITSARTNCYAHDVKLNVGPFYGECEEYQVQCTNFLIVSAQITSPSEFVTVVIDDWAENGYCQGFGSNQLVVCSFRCNITKNQILNESTFTVKNMRQQRQIRVRFYDNLQQVLVSNGDVGDSVVNILCTWQMTFIVTPIK
jgi:hypothetical protein